ncbi:unnamed protein product [Victoria cruziana]
MAVHEAVKRQLIESSDDDDDRPLVFRKGSISSKTKQLDPLVSRTPLKKTTTDIRSLNSQKANFQADRGMSSTKVMMKKPLPATLQVSALASSRSESSEQAFISNNKPKFLGRPSNASSVASDDSDDDKPLKFRRTMLPKVVPNPKPEILTDMKEKISPPASSEDSEDDKPLALRAAMKPSSSAGVSIKPDIDSDEEDKKPLSYKLQQNGSSCGLNGQLTSKPNCEMKKRPLVEVNRSSSVPSAKKAKTSSISSPAKVKVETGVKREPRESSDDEDYQPIAKGLKKPIADSNSSLAKKVPSKVTTIKKPTKKLKKTLKNSKSQYGKSAKVPPGSGGGKKWTTLEHNGVIFPPPYKSHGVKMLYNGEPVDLTPEQEEVATMFAVMKDTEYATKKTFIENFMNDWRAILGKNHKIKKFELCDFTPIYDWYQKEKEKKKQMSSEEKKVQKEEKLKQEEKYMWAIVDGVKEKVGNFRVEPPGLFRGRGEHPKMGKLKRRIMPKDITINIGKGAPIPECSIPGQRWKEVKHDNTVTWLAYWNDPINSKEFKYVFLAASSSLKGQSDKEKYEKARKLKDYIDDIRKTYTKHFNLKTDITQRQIAVATYLIDKLALRAGNEKDDDEADTVGCCTLKVENVKLQPPRSLEFDFLGKDSIRYRNTVEVELPVYEAIGRFKAGKKEGDDLFDRLDTTKLNAHLKSLMPGLTAKVFRTYNASITLDTELRQEEVGGSWQLKSVAEKVAAYQTANKKVAIICNHQRAESKSHASQIEKLSEKATKAQEELETLEEDLRRAKKGKPPLRDPDGTPKKTLAPESLMKKIAACKEKIEKIDRDIKTKEEMKNVALGTSKINYMDPRISVSWCKRNEVPIEKIFNKSLLAKFAWAMDVEPEYGF